MQKTIVVNVAAADGAVKIETSGFVGTECDSATKGLEAVLQGETADEKKPEYYQQPVSNGLKQGS